MSWGCSSVGRAPALQAGGQGFESLHLQEIMRQWPGRTAKESAAYLYAGSFGSADGNGYSPNIRERKKRSFLSAWHGKQRGAWFLVACQDRIIDTGKEKPGTYLENRIQREKISDGLRDQSVTRHPRIDGERSLFIRRKKSNESCDPAAPCNAIYGSS